MELESTERGPRFAKVAVSLKQEQVQIQEPQLRQVEPSHCAAQEAWLAVESNAQSLTASKSVMQADVMQLGFFAREREATVVRIREERD